MSQFDRTQTKVFARGTIKKEGEPIQLSREHMLYRKTVKERFQGQKESLFIVPWQQLEK